jgi:CHAD domain-containing protein
METTRQEPTRQDEVERKYQVDPSTIMPSLAEVPGVASVSQPVEHHLEAAYFDTAGVDIARRGITLRRRTGGDDAGWHLKLPGGADTRTEVRLPLGGGAKVVPPTLLEPVRVVVRDRPLAPVARLRTRRCERDLVAEDGTVLAHVCDDEVRAEPLVGGGGGQSWREWEIEVVDDHGDLLSALEARLLEAGASAAEHGSKLMRALGDALATPSAAPRAVEGLGPDRASALFLDYVEQHVSELHRQDARVRAEHAESVHKMRVATRRLRSALTTYRPLLAAGSTEALRQELRWLGQSLGEARDAQVLRERFDRLVAAEPVELVMGPVAARLDGEMGAREQRGREKALETLDSARYYRLLDALDEVLAAPPVVADADGSAVKVVPRLIQRDGRRLRRAVKAVVRAADARDRDLAFHEARKKSKRLRYAAESAIPIFPQRAEALASAAEAVQEVLGERQDTVVSRQTLRECGVSAHLSGENGFTFGRLHALEQQRSAELEQAFTVVWKDVPRGSLRRWLRS